MSALSFSSVLLGGDQNVYGMARSIHEAYGISSLCIAKVNFPVTKNSKILRCKAVKDFDTPEVFVKTLKELANELPAPRLLLSCGDNYTALLSRCAKDLEELYEFSVPKQDLILRLCEKENFYKVCDEYGFKYPKTAQCSFDSYEAFQAEFSFPVVVKASDSVSYWKCSFPGKKKVFVASDEEELRAILRAIYSSEYRSDLIIQEYIPGADDCMRVINAYCRKGGGVRFISLGHILLEEHTAQGIGSYAAIMGGKDDDLCMKIKTFLEKIGYEGYVNIDIKKDPRSGEYNFFEINPRQGRSSYFVTASGDNLASFAVEDLIEKKDLPLQIGHGECVWSIVPKGIISRYVSDEAIKREAKRQTKQGGYIRHLYYRKDMSLKRLLSFAVNQLHYYKKYRENFNKKGYFEK